MYSYVSLIRIICQMHYTKIVTFPYWSLAASRKVWGRLGYLILRSCKSVSARSNNNSNLSTSDKGPLKKDHEVQTGDFPVTCSIVLSFNENITASNLLMVSRPYVRISNEWPTPTLLLQNCSYSKNNIYIYWVECVSNPYKTMKFQI